MKAITFADLARTLTSLIASARVGQPVNVRIHWQFDPGSLSLETAAVCSAVLADVVLKLANPRWTLRRSAPTATDVAILNALCLDDRGRTALITLATGGSPELSLTVYGNHGVANLNATRLSGLPDSGPDWLSSFEQRLKDW